MNLTIEELEQIIEANVERVGGSFDREYRLKYSINHLANDIQAADINKGKIDCVNTGPTN